MNEVQMEEQLKHSIYEQRVKLAALEVPANTDAASREQVKGVVADSFVFGFRVIMMTAAGLALASGASSWFFIRKSGVAKTKKKGN
jgi:hypothetical protein